MAVRATAVIGSLWGDEGKGSIVHDVVSSSRDTTLVCRYSGGANAGHTVVTDDGRRHVFSHFGSGSFAGADTYLSRFFISNPMLWKKELAELSPKAANTRLFVDRGSLLTTPIDIAINQAIELGRGMLRHGSCGVGINETVTRNEHDNSAFHADVSIIRIPALLRAWLDFLREEYLPARLCELGLEELPEGIRRAIFSGSVFDAFCADASLFAETVTICDAAIFRDYQHAVFEGSQGLLLDEQSGDFPHVTRARTGSRNIHILCDETGISDVDTIYVSRAYATRHGVGPFNATDGLSYDDPTNVPNPWQGTMRFGRLDIDILADAISSDHIATFHGDRSIALTCMDQVKPNVIVHLNGRITGAARKVLADVVTERTALRVRSSSYGPKRLSIRKSDRKAA